VRAPIEDVAAGSTLPLIPPGASFRPAIFAFIVSFDELTARLVHHRRSHRQPLPKQMWDDADDEGEPEALAAVFDR